VIILRNLKVGQRIESGRGDVVGKLALLEGVIYERRGKNEWRRVKDQERGRRIFDEANGKRRRSEWPSRKQLQGALILVLEALGGRFVLMERQAEVLETLANHFVFHLASCYSYQAVFREVYARVRGVGRPAPPETG
jgi:hypothetical protein